MIKKASIQGVNVHNINHAQFWTIFDEFLKGDKKRTIGFVNSHSINVARKDEEYKQAINNFDLILSDGFGVFIASLIKNISPRLENLNGSDLIPLIFKRLSSQNVSFFFVGGTPTVIANATIYIRKQYPKINITGYSHGYFNKEMEYMLCDKINECKPDILVVGMGEPKQEKWIFQNKDRINAKIFIGVGGLFDIFAGCLKRPPKWIRKIRSEWLYRLYEEPRRLWKRFLIGNFVFLYHACKDAFKAN